jgi:putative ABC transport system substrate-binding protein
MRRRDFIAMVGAAGAWPATASAQSQPLRIGIISFTPRTSPHWVAFGKRLDELGYIQGRNLAVEFIDARSTDDYPKGMNELIGRNVDVLMALGGEVQIKSALNATSTLPIVMVAIDYDPLALGYVKSLARPTNNVTGLVFQQIELAAKRVELMKEAFPNLAAATVFWDEISADQWKATEIAGKNLGLKLSGIELRSPPYDYETALSNVPTEYRRGLIGLTSPPFFNDRERIVELANRHRMASMFVFREHVVAGGLMSYGVSIGGLARRAAEYVDRIAKGGKPADLPIEQPTKFELILSLKTAKALDIVIPQSTLLRADEIIE